MLQGLGWGLWRGEEGGGMGEGVTRTHWPFSPTSMVTGQAQEPLLQRARAPQHCLPSWLPGPPAPGAPLPHLPPLADTPSIPLAVGAGDIWDR